MIDIYLYIALNDWKVTSAFLNTFSRFTTMLEFGWCVFHVYLVQTGDLHVTGPPVPLGWNPAVWHAWHPQTLLVWCLSCEEKKKIPSCTLHWGNGNWEAPGYLSGFTRRHRLQNSNYTLRAPHLKHNSRKWRVHVMWIVSFRIQKARQAQELLLGPHANGNNTCKWFTFCFCFSNVCYTIYTSSVLARLLFQKDAECKTKHIIHSNLSSSQGVCGGCATTNGAFKVPIFCKMHCIDTFRQ